MNYRDFLQQLIYRLTNPLIRSLIRIGVTPNTITTLGFLFNGAAAVLFILGGLRTPGEGQTFVGYGGGILLFAGLFDMMDGRLARQGNMCSTFGALYDSVLDRYSELVTLFGILFFLFLQGYFWSAVLTAAALIGSLMVSYVRARAEGLGIECKTGLMQRPERVVLTSLGCILFGCVRECPFPPVYILVVPIGLIAILANWTAIVRINHCKRELNKQS